jgi:hypothetical protein
MRCKRNMSQKFGDDRVLPRSNAGGSLCGFYGKTRPKNGAGMGFSFLYPVETPVNGDHEDALPVQKTASKGYRSRDVLHKIIKA